MAGFQNYDINSPEIVWVDDDRWIEFRYFSHNRGSLMAGGENLPSNTSDRDALTISVKHTASDFDYHEDFNEVDDVKLIEEVYTTQQHLDSTTGEDESNPNYSTSKFNFVWQEGDGNDGEEECDRSSSTTGEAFNYQNGSCLEEEVKDLGSGDKEIVGYREDTPHGWIVPSTGVWQDYLFCWNTRRIWQEGQYQPPRRTWKSIAPLEQGERLQLTGRKLTKFDKIRYSHLGFQISQKAITEGEHQALKEQSIRKYRCRPSSLRLCQTNISDLE